VFVFLGGFVVMVLEIVGARSLLKDFGGSYYVWISQIGVILMALALGYSVGGALADKFRRADFLAAPLLLAGIYIFLIPNVTPPMLDAIAMRHPKGEEMPLIWLKLDPAMGSAVVFFLPCVVLAVISPYMTRVAAQKLERVGTISGLIYAASTVGSIVGVFISGYVFLDYLTLSNTFRLAGVVTVFLAVLSVLIDYWMKQAQRDAGGPPV
jgi:predicted MFS family arabinose efflux permease